jgi:hypothetical protein
MGIFVAIPIGYGAQCTKWVGFTIWVFHQTLGVRENWGHGGATGVMGFGPKFIITLMDFNHTHQLKQQPRISKEFRIWEKISPNPIMFEFNVMGMESKLPNYQNHYTKLLHHLKSKI